MAVRTLPTLQSRGAPLASSGVQIEVLRRLPTVPAFEDVLARHALAPLRRGKPSVLQVNVGKMCNQTCRHCPRR